MKHDPADEAMEAELHSLRPRELPDRLVRAIEASIDRDGGRAARKAPPWLQVAAVAGAMAACVAVVMLLRRDGVGDTPPDDRVASTSQAVGGHPAPPGGQGRAGGVTLGEYQAALARSPQAVDALLEQDAPRPPAPAQRPTSFRAFHGSALDLLGP